MFIGVSGYNHESSAALVDKNGVLIDYYQRSETYEIENSDENFAKTVAGPRILLGLAYRF